MFKANPIDFTPFTAARVGYRNGWRDAIVAVVDDIAVAADVARTLLETTMSSTDLATAGLPTMAFE